MNCLYCKSDLLIDWLTDVVDQRGVSSKKYLFKKCTVCGSLQQSPFPTKDEIIESYPPNYTFKTETKSFLRSCWNKLEWSLFYKPIYGSSVNIVKRQTGLDAGRLLEIGCGSGLRLYQFKQAGFECKGVDFSAEDIKYAKNVLGLNAEQVNLDTDELEDNGYNIVVANHVIEHLFNPEQIIDKMKNVLADNGWVVIGIPMIDSWIGKMFTSKWSAVTEVPRHITIPSSVGVHIALIRKEFTNIKIVPSSAFDLAANVALTLYPRASYSVSAKKNSFVSIIDRLISAFIMLAAVVPVKCLSLAGVSQGLTLVFAQKKSDP